MSKITMTFDMEQGPDRHSFKLHSNAERLASVLWDLDMWLRDNEKYQNKNNIPIGEVRQMIRDLYTENGMVWDDIHQ